MNIIEALKNPDFKKVWEEVIRNKYPEAKSLEEAFKIEKGLCEYVVEVAYYGINSGIPADSKLPSLFNELGAINERRYFTVKEYGQEGYSYIGGTIYKKSINQYLGRPITLEDILILIDGKVEYCGIEDGYHIFGHTFQETNDTNNYLNECFRLKARTEFDEQTAETWKAIAEIMTY